MSYICYQGKCTKCRGGSNTPLPRYIHIYIEGGTAWAEAIATVPVAAFPFAGSAFGADYRQQGESEVSEASSAAVWHCGPCSCNVLAAANVRPLISE